MRWVFAVLASVLYDSQTRSAAVDANRTRVLRRTDTSAFGLRFGGEGSYRLPGNWRLFGRAGTSLLLAHSDALLMDTNNDGASVVADVSEGFSHVVPVLEAGVGLGWHCGRWQVRGGYELAHWINLIGERDFVDDVNEGKAIRRWDNLSLDGLFLQLSLGW